MGGKKKGKADFQKLYVMDDPSIARLEVLHTDTGRSRSQLVREAVMAYDPRSVEQLKQRAAELQAMAEKKEHDAPASPAA